MHPIVLECAPPPPCRLDELSMPVAIDAAEIEAEFNFSATKLRCGPRTTLQSTTQSTAFSNTSTPSLLIMIITPTRHSLAWVNTVFPWFLFQSQLLFTANNNGAPTPEMARAIEVTECAKADKHQAETKRPVKRNTPLSTKPKRKTRVALLAPLPGRHRRADAGDAGAVRLERKHTNFNATASFF